MKQGPGESELTHGQACFRVNDRLQDSLRQQPLLGGVMATGAGFGSRVEISNPGSSLSPRALVLYCVKGAGWCEVQHRLNAVKQGDFIFVPPGAQYACGSRALEPWRVYWVEARGALLPDYFREFSGGRSQRIVQLGEDARVVRLFNEVIQALSGGNVVLASHALAHLLAAALPGPQAQSLPDVNAPRKVAEAIIWMSEHMGEPLRIASLARVVGLSSAYFTGLFREQTGCAPRDYLHLLRLHRACHLLKTTELSVKQISAQVGYADPLHFSRQFKTFHGISPSQYRA